MGFDDKRNDRKNGAFREQLQPRSGGFRFGQAWVVRLLIAMPLISNACGPSALEVYLEGQKLLGRAERGSCKLFYDKADQTHVINGSRVYTCLNEVRKAYGLLLEGHSKGHDGLDVQHTLEKVKEDIERLESMYRMVSKMEMDKQLDGR